MKAILLILAFFAISAIFSLLNSCCGGVAYDGRFATYSIDEQGRLVIAPYIHGVK
jgi:hypothetical protein